MRSLFLLALAAFAGLSGCSHVRVGVRGTVYVPTLHSHESRVSRTLADVVVATADEVSPRAPAKSVRVTVHNRSASKGMEVVWDKMVAVTVGGTAHPLIPGALKPGESFREGHPMATIAHANAFVPPGAVVTLDAFPGDREDLFAATPPSKPRRGEVVEQGSVIVPLLVDGQTDYITVPISYSTDADYDAGKRKVEPFRYATQFDIPLGVNILFGTLCACSYGILCTAYLVFPLPGQHEEAQQRAADWLKGTYGPTVEVIESEAFRLGY